MCEGASLRSFVLSHSNAAPDHRRPGPIGVMGVALAVVFLSVRVAGAGEPPGAALYQQKCARCHGKAGEGTKVYPQALVGNRSLPQLAKYIARSMPEDDPGTVTGADAEKVAGY